MLVAHAANDSFRKRKKQHYMWPTGCELTVSEARHVPLRWQTR